MRIKLDENLPMALADALRTHGHDVDTVADEALTGERDKVVWQAAQQAGRFLITQDLDFSDLRSFAPGSHAGILLIRLARPGRQALFARVSSLFESEDVTSWQGCFVVASDRKLRVRRPAS
jgi:predicted nuclease of predicted toxin-antitoxin system